MWVAVTYILCTVLIGVGISGLLCVPLCWQRCWPRGQPLPLHERSWLVYFSVLGGVLILWSVAPIMWFTYSPISVCSPRWMRSALPNREATTMVEWEGFWCTRRCGESVILHPTNVDELRTILSNATSLRVVGSGHSATDLQCPDPSGAVLSIDRLCSYGSVETHANGTHVATWSSSCTISNSQHWLMAQGYQLVGYGAIMSQTVAGALATSLHGEFTNWSFGDNIVSLRAVTASGDLRNVTGDKVFAWVGSMGELGVIVEVTMRVFPTIRVSCETQRGSQADTAAVLADESLTMVVIDALIGADAGAKPFAIRTCREIHSVLTGEPIVVDSLPDGTVDLLYETYGLSILRLWSTVPIVRGLIVSSFLLASPRAPHEENAVDESFNSAKGIYNVYPHSELAVPVDFCMYALDRMREEADRIGVAYVLAIKIVPPSLAWRTWAVKRSCTINLDFYDFGHSDSVQRDLRFRAFTEDLVVDELGGGLHLGKMWVRPDRQQLMRNAPRATEFEALRKSLDPSDKLQNEHTRASHGDGHCTISPLPVELDRRSNQWRTLLWYGLVVSVVVSIGACGTYALAARRQSIEARLDAKPLKEGASMDGLPLLVFATRVGRQ